jgi:phage-related tail protein
MYMGEEETLKELDKICVKEFDYSPDTLNELYDSLEHCHTLIHYYLDTTSTFSENMREAIATISKDADLLYLDMDELFIISGDFINVAKREYYLKEKVKADKKKVRDFQDKLEKTRNGLAKLIVGIRVYIEKVHEASHAII